MLFTFLLFAILGWCTFAPPQNKTALMIVFIVLMCLWLLVGVTGYELPRMQVPR